MDFGLARKLPLAPAAWLSDTNQGSGENKRFTIPQDEQVTEFLLMGLRTTDGIDLARLESQFSHKLNTSKINDLVDLSLISVEDQTLRATDQGRPVLNGILRELTPD